MRWTRPPNALYTAPVGKTHLISKYILFELIPVFLMGLFMFIMLLFMFQSFKLSEFILLHGAKVSSVMQLFFYFCLVFMPIVLPTSLLFAVLMVYGRLSNDSEIVAMKALGIRPLTFTIPALVLGVGVAFASFQISSKLAPWGKRQRDNLAHELSQSRPTITVREGVFSEGFFDLVVYANQVDKVTGALKKVFIYDERDPATPLTIIAQQGEIVSEETEDGRNAAILRLQNGNLHRTNDEFYTKVDFGVYDINLTDTAERTQKETDIDALDMTELSAKLKAADRGTKEYREALLEWYGRFTLPTACLIFALLGVGLGTVTNRRAAKSGGIVVCVSVVIVYWIAYASLETIARQNYIPAIIAVWLPNLLFGAFGVYRWYRMSRV